MRRPKFMESISIPEVNWIRPDPEREKGEIERVLCGFLGLELNEENFKRLVSIIEKAAIVELSDEAWEILENTDSFHNIRTGHIEDVEKITEDYNRDLPQEKRRSVAMIKEGFMSGREMQLPIIVMNIKGIMHLLSGNTRLMVARALGIRPKVIIAKYID